MSVVVGQIILFIVDMGQRSYRVYIHDSNLESVIGFIGDAFEFLIDKSCAFVDADTTPEEYSKLG